MLGHRKINDISNKGIGSTCNHKKLKLGEYQYLKDRVCDLENKLQVVLSQVEGSDEEVINKIAKMEDKLIRYHGLRLRSYKDRV